MDMYISRLKKGMYGLKQAAVLAYNNLVNNLRQHGYAPIPQTVGLWKHKTLLTTFCLCVNDFGIKCFKKEHADHLLNALKTKYKISVVWNGTNYCGLTLKWNYALGHVNVSMPGYIPRLLGQINYKPKIPTHTPYRVKPPNFSKTPQYAEPPDTSPLLSKKDTNDLQKVNGSLLY